MQALIYSHSIPRYLLSKALNHLWPRHFFSRVSPLNLHEVDFTPPPGWVILRSRMCGICGSDLRLLQGNESFLLEPYASFPAILGHEVVAEVVEAPPESGWRSGERVVVEPLLPCEVRGLPPCRYCARQEYNLCERFTSGELPPGPILGYNRVAGGGMAAMLAAHSSRLLRLPDILPDETAVLIDSLASALQPLLDNFPGDQETVLIFGAGIIGQHLVRLLRVLGSKARIIIICRYPFQQDLALTGGADVALLSPDRTTLGKTLGACFLPTTLGGGNLEGGADILFDCVGSRTSMQEGLLALRARGKYVMVATIGSVQGVDLSSIWFRELHLTGSSMYAGSTFRDLPVRTYQMAIDLLARNPQKWDGLLSHLFSLQDYRQAFQTAFAKSRHSCLKVAFDLR